MMAAWMLDATPVVLVLVAKVPVVELVQPLLPLEPAAGVPQAKLVVVSASVKVGLLPSVGLMTVKLFPEV
jgi:hypothetical protein